MAWKPHTSSDRPSRGLVALLTVTLITSLFGAVVLPTALGHADTGPEHVVNIDAPTANQLVGSASPFEIQWDYSDYSPENDRTCTIWVNGSGGTNHLQDSSVTCAQPSEADKTYQWALPPAVEDPDATVTVQLKEQDLVGLIEGSGSDTVTIRLDTRKPRLLDPRIDQAAGERSLNARLSAASTPNTGAWVTTTGEIRITVEDLTPATMRAFVGDSPTNPRGGSGETVILSGTGSTYHFSPDDLTSTPNGHGDVLSIVFNASDETGRRNQLPAGTQVYIVGIDDADPTVTGLGVDDPDDGAIVEGDRWVRGTITLKANATDPTSGVHDLVFERDGNPLGSATAQTAPLWSTTVDTTLPPWTDGMHTITASATDVAGNTGTNPAVDDVTIWVDNTDPTGTFVGDDTRINARPTLEFILTDAGSGIDDAAGSSITIERAGPDGTVDDTAQILASSHWEADGYHLLVEPSVADYPNGLPNGDHTFTVSFQDNVSNAGSLIQLVTVNDREPILDTDQDRTRLLTTTRPQQGSLLTYNVTASDASGLESLRLVLLRAGTEDPVTEVGGGDVIAYVNRTFPDPNQLTDHEVDVHLGNATAAVPLGTYVLNLTVSDVFGRINRTNLTTVVVKPELRIDEEANVTDDRLTARILAGARSTTTPAGGTCEANTDDCSLSRLIVTYRDANGDLTPLVTKHVPAGYDTATGLYIYELDEDISDLDGFTGHLRFTGNVSFGDTAADNHEVVKDVIAEGARTTVIDVVTPRDGDVNATGEVAFAVDLQQLPAGLQPEDAEIAVTLEALEGTHQGTTWSGTLTPPESGDGTGVWTSELPDLGAPDPLARGAYDATFVLRNASASEEIFTLRSTFNVETDEPTVTILPRTYTVNAGTKWVGTTLDLNVTVDTGFANLPSLESLAVRFLSDPAGWSVSPDIRWDHEDETTGELELPPRNAAGEYELNATVKVPEVIGHKQSFNLFVNATDDANGTGEGDGVGRTGYGSVLVKLDKRAPTVELHRDRIGALNFTTWNATLTQSTPHLAVNVTDDAAGVRTHLNGTAGASPVTVVVYRERDGDLQPYVGPAGGTWSSDTSAAPLPIDAVHPTAAWKAFDSTVFPFIQSNPAGEHPEIEAYYVGVRFTDQVGNAGETALLPISPDLGPPWVAREELSFRTSTGPSVFTRDHITVRWGGADGSVTVRANVTEDEGILSAKLLVERPDGTTATVAATVPGACGSGMSLGTPCQLTWTLDGDQLDQVGPYRLGVQATDTSFQKRATLNGSDGSPYLLSFRVRDTIAPRDESFGFDPPFPAPQSTVYAYIEAFDDTGVRNASILWYNFSADGIHTKIGPEEMTCSPSDPGEPRRVRCEASKTGSELNLEKDDVWFVNFTVYDEAGKSTLRERVDFTVVDNAPPVVRVTKPVANVKWVTATPEIEVVIEDDNLDPSLVTLRTGPDVGNLTEETPTLIQRGIKHYLNFTASGLTHGGSWVLNLTAEDDRGAVTHFQRTFEVDDVAPNVNATLQGTSLVDDGTTWVRGDTVLLLNVTDAESGKDTVRVRFGDGDLEDFTEEPITFESAAEGPLTVAWEVMDVAGNAANGTIDVSVDRTGPSVRIAQHGRNVSALVEDAGVGLDEDRVTLLYTVGGSTDYSSEPMAPSVGNVFQGSIPDDVVGDVAYYIEAHDALENVGRFRSAEGPYNLSTGNEPPTVRIRSPADGAVLNRQAPIQWTASDPDGDPVTVSVSLRPETGGTQELVSGLPATGDRTLDLTGLDEGAYTLVVRASDGSQSSEDTVAIQVLNRDIIKPGPDTPPPQVNVGDEVTISVQVDNPLKTVDHVSAVITRDGQQVDTILLEDKGEGVYSATFAPQEPGNYKVTTVVDYTDGTRDTSVNTMSWTTNPGTGAGFPTPLLMLVVLGALVVILGAYAAFGRWDG